MDDVMHHAVPPIPEHDADGEAVGDIESRIQPNGNQKEAGQNEHADPKRCADVGQRRAVVLRVHRGEVRFSVQHRAVQDVLQQRPKEKSSRPRNQPFTALGPRCAGDTGSGQPDDHHGIDHEVRVIAEFAGSHRPAPRRNLLRYLITNCAEC